MTLNTELDSPEESPTLAAAYYRRQFRWCVEEIEDHIYLALGRGVVGIAAQPGLAAAIRRRLRLHDACGPVLGLNVQPRVWVFLADPNELVLTQPDLPSGVLVLGCPRRLPLPTLPGSATRWIAPPDPHNRWLPTLASVVSAAGSALNGRKARHARAEPA